MKTRVSHRLEFECAYVLDHELNAHRYRLEVTVEGPQRLDSTGVVLKFDELANYMRMIAPDKCFLYHDEDRTIIPVVDALRSVYVPCRRFSFIVSAENLCRYFAESLQECLDSREPGVRVVDVKLRESNDSFACWTI